MNCLIGGFIGMALGFFSLSSSAGDSSRGSNRPLIQLFPLMNFPMLREQQNISVPLRILPEGVGTIPIPLFIGPHHNFFRR